MMAFRFGKNSLKRLDGVHPDLVRVAHTALSLSPIDFSIVQGVRTRAEQDALYEQGRTKPGNIVTWTRNSNHIPKADGFGYAIDICPFVKGKLDWETVSNFEKVATAFKDAAAIEGVRIEWGGDWVTVKDRPHFEMKGRE